MKLINLMSRRLNLFLQSQNVEISRNSLTTGREVTLFAALPSATEFRSFILYCAYRSLPFRNVVCLGICVILLCKSGARGDAVG